MTRREISEAEAAFNAQIVEAFRAGQSVPAICKSLRVQSTIVQRVLRAVGLVGDRGR